jgi:penicillin-binding protein 1A
MYLDRAYMGGGAFGVEAASQFYFGKSVREITMAEAAMLAGLFKAPTKYAPHVNLAASRARTNEVLSNLVEAGYYSSGEVQQARLHPAKVVEQRRADSPDYFLDWAFEEIQRIMEGKGQYVLTARTTIDLKMQSQAEAALTATINEYGRSKRVKSGAFVAMSPDGAVRAVVGGLDYGESQFNRAVQSRRQPGSSFKLYVYAAALENGYKPTSTVRDSSRSCGRWHPQNYSGGHGGGGSMPMWLAFAKSLNTTAAELSFAVGREKVIELTQRLGVRGVRKTCSMALGDTGISPIEHIGAYAHFANGGKSAQPYAVIEAFNSKGDLVYARERDEPAAKQVVSRRVAEQMNQIMEKVVTEGTGKRAALEFTNSVGKTGTSSSYRDAWFVGFTGALVAGVWLGNDDYRPTDGVTGGSLPAQTWQSFMAVAHTSMDIPTIPGLEPHPTQVAERERLAALRKSDPTLKDAPTGAGGDRTSSLLSPQTRTALSRLAEALRKASGIVPAETAPDGKSPADKGRTRPQLPGRRADSGVTQHRVTGGLQILKASPSPRGLADVDRH